jgi:hypothetical protein
MSRERSEHAHAREQSAPSHQPPRYDGEDEVRIEAALPRPKCLRNLLVLANAAAWIAIILALLWLIF